MGDARRDPPLVLIVHQPSGGVGNVDDQTDGEPISAIGLGQVKGDTLPDQPVTFTRGLREPLPITYRNLLSPPLDQAGAFQVPGGIGDGWPLNAQHFGQKVLRNWQNVLIAAVAHHEQPARQPLLEAVCTVACDRYHHLFKKACT
jgi:hypothetical protein